ncbi:MAG TPA: DUF11 domain-containing protein [Candidatus Acidoferrales bacterium]|nr:DUF11 domain-containing protein [Candidatus Acidoferrales bacterium]
MSRLGTLVAAALLFLLSPQESRAAVTLGGTQILSTASATFVTKSDAALSVGSNVVETTVASIGSIAVAPKETSCNPQTDTFPVGPPLVRLFTITNNSNIVDAYTVQSLTTTAGSISSVAFVTSSGASTPATVGQTVSPLVQPGQSIEVQVTIATTAIAVGTDVTLSLGARTTVLSTINGLQSDTGEQCGIATAGANFGAPQGSNAALTLLVNGQSSLQALPSAPVTYSIAFENFGGVAALNTLLTVTLPNGVQGDPTTVKINGSPLAGATLVPLTSSQTTAHTTAGSPQSQTQLGQTLSIPIGSVAPGVPETVTFSADVADSAMLGVTFVSTATLQADNAPTLHSQPAGVFVGTANMVYDGATGQSRPISGATIQLIDPALSTALLQPVGPAIAPNTQNSNPFTTGTDGTYSFGLSPAQYGQAGTPVDYTVVISASGYLNRKIQLALTPNPMDNLYSVTMTSLDGQPLATAGGFTLTKTAVSLADVYGVFGNFPLFTTQAVTISKSADRSVASAGDRVVFTVQFTGNGPTTLGTTSIVDTLPPGLVYAPGTARLDGVASEPSTQGRTLTWTLPSLSGAHTIEYATVILPSVATPTSLTNLVAINSAFPSSPGTFASASANATVQVVAGVFTDRIIITGRVFTDDKGTGHFAPGDSGVANVRLYLEDGESVVTDRFGRFDFPSARPGMHVLRLDKTTLPPHIATYDDDAYDSERSPLRLLHGLFDSSLMQDVNFALRRVP